MTNFIKFLERITYIYTSLIMTNINFNKIIAPSSVGLFVIAVSGVCFYFWNNFRKGRGTTNDNNKSKLSQVLDDNHCACCLKPFIIIGQRAECNNCGVKFCKNSCGKQDSQDDNLLCLICHHQRSSLKNKEKWFDKFGAAGSSDIESNNYSSAEKSQIYVTGAGHAAEDSVGTDEDDEEKNSMENLRFIIEKFVEDLVGNVDNTPIDRLYNHPAYKQDTDTPSMAHTALRELVERAVDEARKLPGLGESVTTRTQETTTTTTSTLPINEQSYEELLASAILNKVIEKYQNDRVDENGTVLEEKMKKSRYLRRNKSRESIDELDGSSDFELPSCDEYNSECSSSKTKHLRLHQDPLSLTIEEKIEEVTTTFTPNDDSRDIKSNILNFRNSRRVPFPEYGMDIIDPSQESSDDSQDEANELSSAPMEHITPVETWEENWLFQRKKIQTQSEPVSMLVPNPSADYRALIGDKDAEDTSDLSEFSAQSDEDEEINEQIIEAINHAVPQTSNVNQQKTCINKKNNVMMIINDNFSSEILTDDQTKNNQINHCNQQLESNKNNLIVTSINILDDNNSNSKINDDFDVDSEDKIEKTVDTNFNLKITKDNSEETEDAVEKKIDNGLNSKKIKGDDCLQLDDKIEKIIDEKIMKKNYQGNQQLSVDENVLNNFEEKKNDGVPIIDEKLVHQAEKIQNDENKNSNASDTLNLIEEEKKSVDEIIPDESSENLIIGKSDVLCPNDNNEMCQEVEIKSVSQVTEKKIIDENLELSAPPRPGTIAEREHRKWENAAPIHNNPYSPENIQKRLLERQYAKRSSEVSGNSSSLTSSPSPPLQIVLGASRPDVKRFGRDYYINESKSAIIERVPRPGTSSSSRPASSLSLNSSSTSSDFEHQELYETIEVSNDSSVNQQNNCEIEQNEVIEDILDNKRKNSKNKINAKLNNHGLFDENKNLLNDDKNKIKKISRIDLRAYGFENEIYKSTDDNSMDKKEKRVINKLDLRLYGYDSGIRRTQSNNHIDSNIKKRYLNRNSNTNNKYNKITGKFDDYNWTQSTDDLNNDDNNNNNNNNEEKEFKKFGGMTGAMSVPNIAKTSTYDYSRNKSLSFDSEEEEEEEDDIQPLVVNNNNNNDDIIKQIPSHYNYETDSQSSRTESTDDLPPKYTTLKNIKYSFESLSGEDNFGNRDYSMPSVRRLAQAFNKPPVPIPVPTAKMMRFSGNRDRPTTPDVHIVKTPRQMHSLTARSISREFREELRNISTKTNTPTWNSVIIEQSKTPAGSNEIISSENESGDDLCVIEAGKLKNNIKFWEDIQQKS